ncbi:unnamed protein product [Mytilus edulis]|uniref:Reverse transcriptase zinc-binding domain-containing protein n=1 Tax=Mytilus edulis TaxID=6550 RepID=A0A8S3Q689_MYTED|nr:unnamed protein product [Mytilus edulis]
MMNEEIRKAISNKKVAFYNWKNNGSINDQHNYFLKQKKLTTYELRKQCRLEIVISDICQERYIHMQVTDEEVEKAISKNIEKYLDNPLTKSKWKSFIDNKVQNYWTNKILDDSKMYSTLQYMNCQYTIGKIHPLITTKTANNRDIVRIPSRTKIATGTYIFQSNRASFNKNKVNPTCKLCNKSPETLSHFLLTCESLEMVRKRLVDIIIDMGSELLVA